MFANSGPEAVLELGDELCDILCSPYTECLDLA